MGETTLVVQEREVAGARWPFLLEVLTYSDKLSSMNETFYLQVTVTVVLKIIPIEFIYQEISCLNNIKDLPYANKNQEELSNGRQIVPS